jgi:hypothetical protein
MDLLTSDTERAKSFYTELFGWTAGEESPEFGGYFRFLADGAPVAGCLANAAGTGLADGWTVYLAVPDAKATADAAAAHGGTLREGPTDIADLGTETVLLDPAGARVGAWQPRAFPGFGEYAGRRGTPAYFELLTRDYERAVAFYRDVFGWGAEPGSVSSARQFRLTGLADSTGQTVAGIMDGTAFLPPEAGDQWGIYVKVPDIDAALDEVARLGGMVTRTGEDTPYGRLAGAADPLGAPFKLVG